MKIIFVGGLFPKELRNEIESKSVGVIQYAADALQWAIVDGLDNYVDNLNIVNLASVGSYPSRYKDLKMKSLSFSHKSGSKDLNVGYINLTVYKFYSIYRNTKKAFKNIEFNENEIFVIYGIRTLVIKAAVDLKKANPTLKICLVVPDLPEFMSDNDSFAYKTLKKLEKKLLDRILKKVDYFVLLSDYMHEPLNVGQRPWIRVEGIFNSKDDNIIVEKEHFKTILYTGTLAKRYGILNLLNAFALIKDENYRLWICGDGDAKDELDEMARNDKRITSFGQIPREQVLNLQKKATVLVNPRLSEGDFTKYSFPSKTMEYLASGTPCIMHNLAGIPKEYFDYCFVSKEETANGLYQTIISVCEMDQLELNKFGERAKDFIFENKLPAKQCEKIFNMLATKHTSN
ncbi:glycosyltransferase [Flavobacterium tructae]|uniref:Glycosyl transferase family 1 domain-containing protein n=1 Tax=Flavobacterium tructae TaxID=1114873 RepID=A0A1S1J4E8_9FLAO|nr:glycosyltransferase [Flavobacterium tructae]OHT44640.1 hypothetical protein BHE19_13095 [Flavobacterium tructae]OXB19222.1 hypothetical protein B0A71_11775 [Flavobacterium tructae]